MVENDTTKVHSVDKVAALKGLVLFAGIILITFLLSKIISKEYIEQLVLQAGIRGPVVIVLLKISTVVFAPLPGSFIYIVAGGAYGVWTGFVYTMLGNLVGMSLCYWIGKKRGLQAIRKLVGKSAEQEIAHLVSHLQNTKTFVITRIILSPLEDLINYAAGMSKISFKSYFFISAIVIAATSLVPLFFGNLFFG